MICYNDVRNMGSETNNSGSCVSFSFAPLICVAIERQAASALQVKQSRNHVFSPLLLVFLVYFRGAASFMCHRYERISLCKQFARHQIKGKALQLRATTFSETYCLQCQDLKLPLLV